MLLLLLLVVLFHSLFKTHLLPIGHFFAKTVSTTAAPAAAGSVRDLAAAAEEVRWGGHRGGGRAGRAGASERSQIPHT